MVQHDVCAAPLALVLRPGPVPGSTLNRQAPARDIPSGVITMHFPLYPGATPSTLPISGSGLVRVLPAGYRKVASAEFVVPTGYRDALAWYEHSLTECGFIGGEVAPLQRHGGTPFAGVGLDARNGLSSVFLLARPLSSHLTAIRYVVQTLDLPPRPRNSYLHGPFIRMVVQYRSVSAVPGHNRSYRFTVTWPATIRKLRATVNRLDAVFVSGLAVCGAVISSQYAVVSFVRSGGGIRRVRAGGVLDTVVVGKTRRLDDTNAAVMRLIGRIVAHRCRGGTGCI